MSLSFSSSPEPQPYGLTKNQRWCLFVIQEMTDQGHPPSLSEICTELDMKSRSEAHKLLCGLKTRGWVDWIPGHRRSLTLKQRLPWPPEFHLERPPIEIARLP